MQNIKLVVECKGFGFQKGIFTLRYKVTFSSHHTILGVYFMTSYKNYVIFQQ